MVGTSIRSCSQTSLCLCGGTGNISEWYYPSRYRLPYLQGLWQCSRYVTRRDVNAHYAIICLKFITWRMFCHSLCEGPQIWFVFQFGSKFSCFFSKARAFRFGLLGRLLRMFFGDCCFPGRDCMVKFPEDEENTPGIKYSDLKHLGNDANNLVAGIKCLYLMDKPKSSFLR